jgi:hypothetical protein
MAKDGMGGRRLARSFCRSAACVYRETSSGMPEVKQLLLSGTRGPEVAQQVGGPNAELAVLIEEPGLGFRARETLDLRQQLAENRFFRTAELVIIAQVAQRLTCNGANYPRYAII